MFSFLSTASSTDRCKARLRVLLDGIPSMFSFIALALSCRLFGPTYIALARGLRRYVVAARVASSTTPTTAASFTSGSTPTNAARLCQLATS